MNFYYENIDTCIQYSVSVTYCESLELLFYYQQISMNALFTTYTCKRNSMVNVRIESYTC